MQWTFLENDHLDSPLGDKTYEQLNPPAMSESKKKFQGGIAEHKK